MLENGLDEAARIVPVDTPPQSNSPDQLEEGQLEQNYRQELYMNQRINESLIIYIYYIYNKVQKLENQTH